MHPGHGFHIDPDEVLALIGPRTRVLVVISPSNPTGTVESTASLERLFAGAGERGVAVLLDDTYRSLCWVGDGPAPGAPARPLSHVVVCGGLSKSVALTGWRVGWAVCPDPPFMARMVALQQTVLTCAATPVQIAGRAAFTPAGVEGARSVRARFRARRDLVARVLEARPGVRFAPLEGAFYAWVEAARAGGGRAFARRLLEEEKIVVIPGEAFGPSGADWVRISYAQEDAALARAMDIIAARLAG